jgi:hypothetical protein
MRVDAVVMDVLCSLCKLIDLLWLSLWLLVIVFWHVVHNSGPRVYQIVDLGTLLIDKVLPIY